MRYLFILALVLTIGSCGRTDRDYKQLFNNESWTFHVDSSLPNSISSFTLNFFGDSLYVYEYNEDSIKQTQLGKWQIEETWFGDHFVMLDQGFRSKFKVGNFSMDEMSISDGSSRLVGRRVRQTDSIDIRHLNGTWVDKTDTLPNPKRIYQQSGKFLTNPIFNFRADSFSIYTLKVCC